jgi:hypothetical protein
MPSPHRPVVAGLALLQIADAIATTHPRMSEAIRLDRLGFPAVLRPVLPVIKVSTAAGLVAGLRSPRIGAVTSAALVSFYAAAVRFHALAGDHPAVAAPAAAFGATAALCFVSFLPVIEAGKTA